MRNTVARARRVVVKVGSSALTTDEGGVDLRRLHALVDVLAANKQQGREVILVSSGAIAAALGPLRLANRPNDLSTQQAAAAVGQGLLIEHYTQRFAQHGIVVGQVLLTVDDLTRQQHYRNAHRTAERLLELGVLPVVNENDTVATHEIRFGDNDRLAALVAHLVHADALVLLTDVDALYSDHPSKPNARRIEEVRSAADLRDIDISRRGTAVGTGGMQTKIEAARIATSAGIPVVLAKASAAADALGGQPVGTIFHPTGKRRPTRLLWLAHITEAKGELVVDDGAVRALTERKASLLPAGVVQVRGTFRAGQPVDVVAADGTLIARGLTNYAATELPDLIGRSTTDLVAEYGPGYERTVIHRDAMALLVKRGEPARSRN
ncbi:glutamate 5-kinase [Enemella sp. A6]|uniref:glutamate 5-kinase n=1 Tax=Enemella sp. A6 TaxID=3440152 RepID=UPI003EB81D1C